MRANLLWTFLFAAIASAAPVSLGTFSVSGSGAFNCDRQDAVAGFSVFFTGSNANGAMVTVSSPGLGGSNFGSNLVFPCFGSSVGENTVLADSFPPSYDSIQLIDISVDGGLGGFSSPYGTFQVGNGGGFLDIYGPGSSPLIPGSLMWTANLIGYVTVDSVTTTGPPDVSANGTFAITPAPSGEAPEPGSAALILAGAVALRSYLALARG